MTSEPVADFVPEGFPASRVAGLVHMDEGHFWTRHRDALALRVLGEPDGHGRRAVDLGCGTGLFASRLAARGFRTVGVEGHSRLLERAASRGAGVELVRADLGDIPLGAGSFDLAVALDVLEHLEPTTFLAQVRNLLRPGGTFLVSVPSDPSLWSRFDEQAGHRCRYTRRQLEAELAAAGFAVERCTHFQFLLLPLVRFSRLLGRRRERRVERDPPAWLAALLGAVNGLEVAVLGDLSLPWGSSLVARCRRSS